MTKAEKILRHIAASPRGLTLREIQNFILRLNHPDRPLPRDASGYYTVILFGGHRYVGLLHAFCRKLRRHRYVVTETIEAPFFRRELPRAAEIALRQRRLRRERRRLAAQHGGSDG